MISITRFIRESMLDKGSGVGIARGCESSQDSEYHDDRKIADARKPAVMRDALVQICNGDGGKRKAKWRLLSRLGVGLIIALAAYLVVYRPLQLHGGATREEVVRAMPGDEIQPRPIFDATRAITIGAAPDRIWPWLVQIGYKRAGWYGTT